MCLLCPERVRPLLRQSLVYLNTDLKTTGSVSCTGRFVIVKMSALVTEHTLAKLIRLIKEIHSAPIQPGGT